MSTHNIHFYGEVRKISFFFSFVEKSILSKAGVIE